MREFANQIIETQSEEIEQMENYLNNWYSERISDYEHQAMMGDYNDLTGTELNQTFLQDMVFHHIEAVMMSQQLLSQGLAQHEEVADLAVSISNSQREEIFMMRNWLADSFSGSNLIGRGGVMGGNMMGRGFFNSNVDRFSNLSEEEVNELRETQRSQLRTTTRIEVLRKEYRQLILEDASEEELREIEDEILTLQE